MAKKKIEFWDKGFNYPNVLELTDEQKEVIELEQAKYRRLNKSRARLSPTERLKARGVELEDHHKQTGNRDGLAEAYAMQGRFTDASKVALRPDLIAQFTEYANAGENDPCQCDKIDDKGMPTEFVEATIFSEKHGKVMPLIRCTACKRLVAKPVGEQLALMQKATSDAENGKEKKFSEVIK